MTEKMAKYRVTGTDHNGYCSDGEAKPIDCECIKFVNSDKIKPVEVFYGCSPSRCGRGSGYCMEGAFPREFQQTWTFTKSVDLTDDIKKKLLR